MNRFTALLFATAIIAGVAQSVLAAPAEYSLRRVGNVSATYDPTRENQLAQSFTVRHRLPNKGTPTDNYFVTFSAGQSGSFTNRSAQDGAGDQLEYQLVDNLSSRDILGDLTMPNLGQQNVLYGTSTISESITQSFYVILNAAQLPPAGTYTDSVLVSVYGGVVGSPSPTLMGSTSMSLAFTVPAVLALSLVPTGATFLPGSTTATMNFGAMSAGETGSMDLLVRSNSSYSISLQSQNGGVMAITLPGDTSTVPYTLTFAGAPVSLPAAAPTSVVTAAPPTSGAGARYPIGVTIGNLGTATAGTYQDNITITVTGV